LIHVMKRVDPWLIMVRWGSKRRWQTARMMIQSQRTYHTPLLG